MFHTVALIVNTHIPGLYVQATAAQQGEMKKIKALQDKLGAELSALSQKMHNLQRDKSPGNAQSQVRDLRCAATNIVVW